MSRLHTFIGPYCIPGPRRVAVARVQQVVAADAGIALEHMRSRDKHWYLAHPRQVAMTLARLHSRHSRAFIGRMFGGRDHTTVLAAERAVRRRCPGELARLSAKLEATC
jgi:chromosomal replication initiation ATPase DnaA